LQRAGIADPKFYGINCRAKLGAKLLDRFSIASFIGPTSLFQRFPAFPLLQYHGKLSP
jgi:hypothetical protein